ncbi:MAG TPA: hypothetical protein VJG83_06050 [archaeon]|nr:hypothetical protein [archaeon]
MKHNTPPSAPFIERHPFTIAERRKKLRAAVKTNVKPFMKGHDANIGPPEIQILRRFIALKDLQAKRKNPLAHNFNVQETTAIKTGFAWLIRGMKPTLSEGQITHFANSAFTSSRKIKPADVYEMLTTLEHSPAILEHKDIGVKEKRELFGRMAMYLDAIDHSNTEKKIDGEMKRFLGLAFMDKILFSGSAEPKTTLSSIAVHELGHKKYGFDEPLCYALQTFYRLSEKEIRESDIDLDIYESEDTCEGYLEGLAIVKESLNQARSEGRKIGEVFFEKVHDLGNEKKYRWLYGD